MRISLDFSPQTLQVKREWDDIFKVLKIRNCQLIILYPSKLFFKSEGEILSPQKLKSSKSSQR